METLLLHKLAAGMVDVAVGVIMLLFVVLLISALFSFRHQKCEDETENEQQA